MKRFPFYPGEIRTRLIISTLLLGLAAPAQAQDLLDYVIQAVDPTLAPARPLIECLAGGGSVDYCGLEAAKKEAQGALPIGPSDNRVQLAVNVFGAAREERWLDVLTIGGELVAKAVSCAMLPLGGPLKGPACSVIDWVIANNFKMLDQAWRALTGPDWWALVDLLGTAACQFIPGEGAAGYARDALCGPLAAVLLEAKKFAEAVGNAAVAGADALENLVFGDDSHMPYDRYYALYWQPWYHYATAHLWQGQGLGPAVGNVQGRCVDYFDSHNQYRSTAKKTCGNMKKKFDREVKGFADALPVAVDGYFETIARPAVRAFARHNFGKPTPATLPGQELFVSNCVFQIRQRFPFPEPNEWACTVLADKAAEYKKNMLIGPLYDAQAKSCFSNVAQQTLDPTVWQLACDELRTKYGQAFAGESLKLMKIIGDIKARGCTLADPKVVGKLLLECPTYAQRAECLEALYPDGNKYCTTPPLKMSDTIAAEQKAGVSAQPSAAALGVLQEQQSGAARRQPPSTAQVSPRAAGRAAGLPPPQPGQPTAGRLRNAVTVFEAEQLLSSGKVQLRGGQATAQDMAGFGPGWSGGAQLFWHGGAVGATLDLAIEVPADGAWLVEIALTQAPDYGEIGFEVDHHPVRQRFDGYAPQVAGPVTVALGTFAMIKGPRPVSLKIAGRNAAASGWLVGVDRIVLQPAGGN